MLKFVTPEEWFQVIVFILAMALLVILGGMGTSHARATYEMSHPAADPRVIGYGCAGASGPLFAAEESDLPPCYVVERL